jgi:hypothetical protein
MPSTLMLDRTTRTNHPKLVKFLRLSKHTAEAAVPDKEAAKDRHAREVGAKSHPVIEEWVSSEGMRI